MYTLHVYLAGRVSNITIQSVLGYDTMFRNVVFCKLNWMTWNKNHRLITPTCLPRGSKWDVSLNMLSLDQKARIPYLLVWWNVLHFGKYAFSQKTVSQETHQKRIFLHTMYPLSLFNIKKQSYIWSRNLNNTRFIYSGLNKMAKCILKSMFSKKSSFLV